LSHLGRLGLHADAGLVVPLIFPGRGFRRSGSTANAVHPDQLAIIDATLTPTAGQVARRASGSRIQDQGVVAGAAAGGVGTTAGREGGV
jgi:hypothetical protein